MNRIASLIIYLVVAGAIVSSDLWTKQWVFEKAATTVEKVNGRPESRPGPPGEYNPWELWPGKLAFECTINVGAFNGWFGNLPWLLLGVSVIAVLVTLAIAVVPQSNSGLMVTSLGLLAGGALGNLYDRVVFGGVRDFIKVYHGEWVWPNFNVADSAICTGVGLLLIRELLMARKAKAEGAPGDDSPTEPEKSNPTEAGAEVA